MAPLHIEKRHMDHIEAQGEVVAGDYCQVQRQFLNEERHVLRSVTRVGALLPNFDGLLDFQVQKRKVIHVSRRPTVTKLQRREWGGLYHHSRAWVAILGT